MSVKQGGRTIAGVTSYRPDLFDWKWADHKLNDVQWLRADTFSWQSGTVYEAAYNHLVADITGKTAQTEVVGGVTISFYLSDDGHKVTTNESAVAQIYAAIGVAWYYVLDTVNQRFKLPRTKFGFTGLRNSVGNYITPGLPDATGAIDVAADLRNTPNGVFSGSYAGLAGSENRGSDGAAIRFNLSNSNAIYGNSNTVQPPATQMYLYFYVGQFTQTALENTAGVTTETLNRKVDKGHEVVEFQAPTSANNYTWYRKYADGWVEQGGVYDIGSEQTASNAWTINLPITMADNKYTGLASMGGRTSGGSFGSYCVVVDGNNTTTGMQVYVFKTETAYRYINWQVSGMAA